MYRSTFFFTSALVGGEWSASRPSRLNSSIILLLESVEVESFGTFAANGLIEPAPHDRLLVRI
jgi:hypothetical protein